MLAKDCVILRLGQVTRTTHELATHFPNYHTTTTGKNLSHYRFNVHTPSLHGGNPLHSGIEFVTIITSDEAHFWLNGYVNKQNCRIWSETNPQVYVETPSHPEKLTVWCALWAGGMIGPYFFKNDEGHNVTVNGDRYRAMITNFFIPELNNHDVQELWFQQDGATCHTARATIDLLKDKFGDRLISRFGPGNWPPRSCDLTQLDYFFCGAM
ncbi:putative transposable element [Trichonephila clavipes]|nr:putative transposable element [Trichonephila clavipes]